MNEQKSDLKQLESRVHQFPVHAKSFVVNDDLTLKGANEFLLSIKAMRKEVDEAFDPIIKKAHEAHKQALMTKKKYEQPLIEAERQVKPQISFYVAELERKRREAEEAARKAEEERKRLEEEKIQAAIEAEEKGDNKRAEEILDEEIPEAKPIPIEAKPQLQNITIRKIWKWRITDEKVVPREFLVVDSSKITNLVRSTKGEIRIPGIEVYSEDSVAARIS